jgi:Ni,Fe-hydrogenase III large subunit
VVVPGGVAAYPRERPSATLARLGPLERQVAADVRVLMATSTFLDRLRGTGPLTRDRAREHGALGPIGKASGFFDDARRVRPYDAYPLLAVEPFGEHPAGDALSRLWVRWDEVTQAFRLVRQAIEQLPEEPPAALRTGCDPPQGRAAGWAEAPQGEVLYDVTITGSRIACCQPRSASFHNLVLMREVFKGDILTDFPFIEASFGLSVAGAAL